VSKWYPSGVKQTSYIIWTKADVHTSLSGKISFMFVEFLSEIYSDTVTFTWSQFCGQKNDAKGIAYPNVQECVNLFVSLKSKKHL